MCALKKILYAEDDLDIRKITLMILELSEFTIESCINGQEVIEKAPIFKPQLMLLDVMMPGIDGVTAFQRLQSQDDTKNIPAIFMTAAVSSKDVEKYLAMGAIGVIAKPYDPTIFVDEITNIYNKYCGGVSKHGQ